MLDAAVGGDPTRPLGHLEHPGEVVGLTGIGHIDHPAGAITGRPRGEAITNRRQVGGGVVEAAIALLHNQRQGLAVLTTHPLQKHAASAGVDHQQPSSLEVVNHRLQVGVVEGFAALSKPYVELVVDLLEFAAALVA